MDPFADIRRRITTKYGDDPAVDIDPALLDRIINDVLDATSAVPSAKGPPPSPFAVPWMDSFLAHWVFRQNVDVPGPRPDDADEVADLLRELVDVRFRERVEEIREYLRRLAADEPPDGGPPEPGTPPVGPEAVLLENPWILYWFISLKAPLLLDVIDAHLTRRMSELGAEGH